MKNYYITVMSIDPNDHESMEAGDDSQKYGLSVQAKDKADAEKKGAAEFKKQHGNLPIYWLRAEEN